MFWARGMQTELEKLNTITQFSSLKLHCHHWKYKTNLPKDAKQSKLLHFIEDERYLQTIFCKLCSTFQNIIKWVVLGFEIIRLLYYLDSNLERVVNKVLLTRRNVEINHCQKYVLNKKYSIHKLSHFRPLAMQNYLKLKVNESNL